MIPLVFGNNLMDSVEKEKIFSKQTILSDQVRRGLDKEMYVTFRHRVSEQSIVWARVLEGNHQFFNLNPIVYASSLRFGVRILV